ncbi:high-affinity potassium ion transmembrane transporter [Aureococcus anophagefferens]|nr:high-affinity potassium ion transmembrane transporter [Aureococcus anophagefferens]
MRYEGDGGRTAASGEAAMGGSGLRSGALFCIVFELTSAFGNVGLSLGSIADPSRPTSYSGDLTAAALLIVCAVQIFGRTRDMPAAVDSGLSLPTVDAADVPPEPVPGRAGEPERGRPAVGPRGDDRGVGRRRRVSCLKACLSLA